tara:strand:- start:324 stop:1013 length:690 start_codon:yes stop_codon:yes gene_type:complete
MAKNTELSTAAAELTKSEINPEFLKAINALKKKKVPTSAIQKRPGKGGKTFSYISHTWATETIQNALGNLWSYDAIKWDVFTDNIKGKDVQNVAALVKFTMHIPFESNGTMQLMDRSVTEVGSFVNEARMPTSNAIAAAISRGLCRCLMRMFGLGIEFYKSDDIQMTTVDAWSALWEFAQNQGFRDKDAVTKAFADAEITKDSLVDRFEDAYRIVAELVGSAKKTETMP